MDDDFDETSGPELNAIANAVVHATGKRVRELPIAPDKVL